MSESNYFRVIVIVRILLKITWKILRGNLKILGFLSQILIKTMYRITKNDRALEENDRAHRKTVPCRFGLARTLKTFNSRVRWQNRITNEEDVG